MKNKYFSLFSFLILLSSFSFSQTVIPLYNLRLNDSTGLVKLNAQTVTVRGIVTCSNQLGANGPGAIQDSTGSVSVYGNTFSNFVSLGDSVQVTAGVSNYNGLAELTMTTAGSSLTKLSTGKYYDTLVLTLSQINNQNWNGYEQYESRLVRINNVSISATGSFAGNTNYSISDSTASGQIRIVTAAVTIVGTPIPTMKVDLIGILGQYKTTAPFNSGYQLQPRFIGDIIADGRPLVLNSVIASNIDTSSFSVFFVTSKGGNSQVKYGLTTGLELDSVVVNDSVLNHRVNIIGLNKSTKYYFKAVSSNFYGRSESGIQSVITASPGTSGTINLYFNYPVDNSVAIPGNNATGSVDFSAKLVNRINSAVYSIDMALYSFNAIDNITNALIAAKNRGVKIRIVYDSRTTQASMQQLLNAGILMSKRPAGTGIMHNKFFIFDKRDVDTRNDWVWTGSWNITNTELTWKNNVVEVNDPSLASAYTTEFEEMWGGSTDIPNPATAKFAGSKTDNTPHSFTIGGINMNLYFSPSDGTNTKIGNALNTARSSIYFAMFSFTRNDLAQIMYNRKQAGCSDIRGLMDDVNGVGSEYSYLAGFAEMFPSGTPIQHHKYCIIDAINPASAPKVITGSHNWSTAANEDNDENTLIIYDLKIANQFMQEFKKRYNDAGGVGTFIIPNGIKDSKLADLSMELYQNYPNPFNPTTTIKILANQSGNISLELYNVLGEKIATLFEGDVTPGIIAVDLNSNDPAMNLSSGVYFYKLKSGSFIQTKKLILLK